MDRDALRKRAQRSLLPLRAWTWEVALNALTDLLAAVHEEGRQKERERCVAVARGSLSDFGGGYHNKPAEMAAFQHGMETVLAAISDSPSEYGVYALECIGRALAETEPKEEIAHG